MQQTKVQAQMCISFWPYDIYNHKQHIENIHHNHNVFVCRNAEFYFENVPTKVFLIQFDFMHRLRYVYDQLILCQKRLSYTDNSTVMVNSYNEYYKPLQCILFM